MLKFLLVIIGAALIGGFVGGELLDRAFSITGAAIAGVGLCATLLGLGAYFTSQEEKKKTKNNPAKPIPKEIQDVFGRMFGSATAAGAERTNTTTERKPSSFNTPPTNSMRFRVSVEVLMKSQLKAKYAQPKEAFAEIMTNRRALGYVFGLHDALLQRHGLMDLAAAEIERSYIELFGSSAGHALFSMSLNSQTDDAFVQGRASGGKDGCEFVDSKIPPLGLARILILGMKD